MSARNGDVCGGVYGSRDDIPSANPATEEHALALASPHRVVVIASPMSAAWQPAFESPAGVFVLDPLRESDADAIGPLQPPNDGPAHTAIPRWGVYDFAEVPGAVIGLLRTPVSSPYRRPLDPLAVLLATPHAELGAWHLYGITVRSPHGPTPAIRAELIRIALSVLRADRVTLVLRWASALLDVLVASEAVEILAARTPLHGPNAEADPIATIMLHRDRERSPTGEATTLAALAEGPLHVSHFVDRVQAHLDEGMRLRLALPSPTAVINGSPLRFVLQEFRR